MSETPPLFGSILELVLYVLIIAFVVHALMLTYHWFTYGNDRKLSTLALTIYLAGGVVLLLTLGVTLTTL